MEFIFHTKYDLHAVTAMAQALRKTTRKKRSKRAHIFGWFAIVLVILLSLPHGENYMIDANRIITWVAAGAILTVFLFEDRINGFIAKKRMLPGLETSTAAFTQSGYRSETELGSSEFSYGTITALAESKRYFFLIFSQNHAQVYDKHGLAGGSCEEFADFICGITGIEMQRI